MIITRRNLDYSAQVQERPLQTHGCLFSCSRFYNCSVSMIFFRGVDGFEVHVSRTLHILGVPHTVLGFPVRFQHSPLPFEFRHFGAIKTYPSRVTGAHEYLFRRSSITIGNTTPRRTHRTSSSRTPPSRRWRATRKPESSSATGRT